MDKDELLIRLQASVSLDKLAGYLANDQLRIIAPQITALYVLISQMMNLHNDSLKEMEQRRLAQGGGPISPANAPAPDAAGPAVLPTQEDLAALVARQDAERRARYKLTHSFGISHSTHRCAAEQLFVEKFAKNPEERADLRDLKAVCMEFGYWLGQDLDSARLILNVDGSGLFSFRDLVSWWTQSERSWLFLLDDAAFRKRHA